MTGAELLNWLQGLSEEELHRNVFANEDEVVRAALTDNGKIYLVQGYEID